MSSATAEDDELERVMVALQKRLGIDEGEKRGRCSECGKPLVGYRHQKTCYSEPGTWGLSECCRKRNQRLRKRRQARIHLANQRYREKHPVTCEFCGAKFVPQRYRSEITLDGDRTVVEEVPIARFCSAKCRVYSHRSRKR